MGAKVRKIEKCGKADVYNMEVDGTHCFAVNGGLVVHNCIDAVRYSVMNDVRKGAYSRGREYSGPFGM